MLHSQNQNKPFYLLPKKWHAITLAFSLLFLVLTAVGCDKENLDATAAPATHDPIVELPDGEGTKSSMKDPGVYTNDAPCGENTVAMIHDNQGRGTFIFGAYGEGNVGVLSSLAPEFQEEDFGVNTFSTPLELLRHMTGTIPQEVALSLIEGEPLASGVPFELEVDFSDFMTPSLEAAEKANAYCGNGGLWQHDYAYVGGFVDNFIKDKFSCGTSAFYSGLNCISELSMFVNPGALQTWSQRTGSLYPDTKYGSCSAYGRVVSCGNYTLLNAWQRESWSGGTWVETLNYWIPPNGSAVWIMYSNSDKSCKEGKDRDDFRFRAESVPGGNHRYGYTFIREHDTHSTPGLCVACP